MNKPKNPLFCFIAESGAGKDLIVDRLTEYGYKKVTSYTTRPRRDGEGDKHIFITPEEVDQYRNNMSAYTNIDGFEYFTTIDQLEDVDLYIIDPIGYKYLKGKITDRKLVPIHISVSEQERFQRALKREENNPNKEMVRHTTESRFVKEFKQFQDFRKSEVFYSVPNYSTDDAVQVILEIMDVESCGWSND